MKFKAFFRTFCISAVIMLCITLGFLGAARAYESMRLIGFGEYKKAVETDDGSIRLFDFEIKF